MKKKQAVATPAATPAATKATGTVPAHLEALLEKLDPTKVRLIFAVDATASRQPTWDMAAKLTAEMFRAAAAGSGGIELQLVFYRGERECVSSRWMPDAASISKAMSHVMCAAGTTQINRVLTHVAKEDARQKVAAAVLIGDACEETPSVLYAAARKLRTPVFAFLEGNDESAAVAFTKIASLTGGAFGRFDAGAAARLGDFLRAVTAYAVGGRQALADQGTAAARLLLTQLK
jgi:hypothetical protein